MAAWLVLGGLSALATRPAAADRYEATIAFRPTGAYARVEETGTDEPAMVRAAGGSLAVTWGLRDQLDVGIDVGAAMLGPARYDTATVVVSGTPQRGELDRRTSVGHLQLGATLRLGARWIPVVHAGLGLGVRRQSDANLRISDGAQVIDRVPDGLEAGLGFDLLATVRVGLDHRFDRHWTAGVSVGAMERVGLGIADLQLVDASVGVAYSWYAWW